MSDRPVVPVSEVPGVDLAFRPRTYFGPLPLETHVLARIAGQERREAVRHAFANGSNSIPRELTTTLLDEAKREAIGKIHPAFMGGEYLPPLLDDEIEIARISLESTTADQISVRARRDGREIVYRIVDEYDGEIVKYECHPERSEQPLALGELIAMIDGACEDGSAALAPLHSNHDLGISPGELENFVTVSSEFYPKLGFHYAHRIEAWLKANRESESSDES